MSADVPRRPLIVRVLLRCVPLGERRDEVESDVAELFDLRRRERGRIHASSRLVLDLVSLVTTRRTSVTGPSHPRGSGAVQSWLLDLRYGLRLFRKHPAVIGATTAGLALAIAVGTTVFTILTASVLRQYGMDDPASVVHVQMRFGQGTANTWPYHAFVAMREQARQLRLVASFRDTVGVSLSAGETPARADSLLFVSGGYLTTLGGRPVLGRTLLPSDDDPGSSPVVVVNHRFWTSRLGADQSVVGKTIWLSGSAVTIAGVIDLSFTGPVDTPPAFWAPFGSYGAISRDRSVDRASRAPVTIVGRVASGRERGAAEQELSAIAATLPDVAMRGDSGGTVPVTGVRLDGASSPMDGPDSWQMLALVGVILLIVGLVLALACANVANLLLAGAAARTREIGVRLALGASRGRILRQLLSESLLIGLMAGGAGLLLSLWLAPLAAAAIGAPEFADVGPGVAVLLFTIAISVLTGLGAGLAPARYGSASDLAGVLKSQGAQTSAPPRAARMRRLFIGFQAAASVLLLITAALFVRAALQVVHVDVGFDADRLVTVVPGFPRSGFDAPAADAYWRAAIDRVRAIPFVEQAALASSPPFGGAVAIRDVSRLQRDGVMYRLYENRTDAAYFTTAGLRLLRGRSYTADEVRGNAPVALVSESIARDFLGGAEPIGASLSAVAEDLATVTIIGVVSEALTGRIRGLGNGTIYRPLPSSDLQDAQLLIRASRPDGIVHEIQQVLLAVDPRVRPVTTVMARDVSRYMREPKVLATVSGVVAILALVLAVLGLYGVTTFVVSQRSREMRVRQAIGASAGDIVGILVRQSLSPVLIGLTAGLALSLAAVRVLAPALSGVNPYDPAAIVGAVAVLLGAATVAVLAPALRVVHADPAAVLRDS